MIYYKLDNHDIINNVEKYKIYIDLFNKYDYELASNDGKLINDLLYKNKLLFYGISDGLDIILRYSENKLYNFESKKNLIDKFKKNICYPISKKKFLFKMNKILLNE